MSPFKPSVYPTRNINDLHYLNYGWFLGCSSRHCLYTAALRDGVVESSGNERE